VLLGVRRREVGVEGPAPDRVPAVVGGGPGIPPRARAHALVHVGPQVELALAVAEVARAVELAGGRAFVHADAHAARARVRAVQRGVGAAGHRDVVGAAAERVAGHVLGRADGPLRAVVEAVLLVGVLGEVLARVHVDRAVLVAAELHGRRPAAVAAVAAAVAAAVGGGQRGAGRVAGLARALGRPRAVPGLHAHAGGAAGPGVAVARVAAGHRQQHRR